MISPELIRRYPFFAGLSTDQIVTLANVAEEVSVEEGHYFFHEGEEICCFDIVVEGAVGIVMELPDGDTEQKVSDQLTGQLATKTEVLSTIGPGEMFGWSALIAPHITTASGKALTPCRVLSFDCRQLRETFRQDCRFGYVMMQKAAQVIRDRLRDMRIESLAHIVA
ncbi:MAG: cyclic nucleotide-binding domain-containing protein [Chloroflexi bacterium]|nr:MAG: cyclic nucleotide-binding domain-containing protein [Chloroflexota bacterium]